MYDNPYFMSTFHLQKLGRRIRELRGHRGLTQSGLAQQASVTRLTVIAIEAGRESVAIGSYARVAAALGAELTTSALTRPTLEELGGIFNVTT